MDTKALRQKILDLAIHGKLVPQDPNDEPASVLLQRIREEKERLIKEGKIKKGKKSAKTSDTANYENVPFAVPKSWVWTTLGEIGNSNIGLTYKPSDICNKGVPVYRSNNIQNGRIYKEELVRVNTKILDKQFLNVGDLLICARNGSRKLVGKCAIIEELTEPTCFGAFMAVCRSAYNPWIYLLLNTTYFDRYLDDSNSATINQVTQSMLLAFKIPLPPLAEQQRIVAEIERWFSLIDIIESGKESLKSAVKQAKAKILDLAIHGKLVPQDPADEPASDLLRRIRDEKERLIKEGKKSAKTSDTAQYENVPFEVPKSWVWTTLGEICSIKGGKRIPKGMSFSNEKTEHIYLRVTNMKQNTIVLDDLKYISNDVYSLIKNYTISSSDLYLTIAGTIGSVGIIPQEVDGMNLTENAAKLTHIACDKKYLLYTLQSTVTQEHFTSKFHQVAQPKLSIETASSANIPLPPLAEQRRIVAKIEQLFAQLDSIEAMV